MYDPFTDSMQENTATKPCDARRKTALSRITHRDVLGKPGGFCEARLCGLC